MRQASYGRRRSSSDERGTQQRARDGSSPYLVLVRHALQVVDADTPPRGWPLSDQGRSDARALARQLDLPAETYVVSSDELKARQTAEAFSHEFVIDRRLREVERPWVEGDYESVARRWLAGEGVDGWESRSDVIGRMRAAVNAANRRGAGRGLGSTPVS